MKRLFNEKVSSNICVGHRLFDNEGKLVAYNDGSSDLRVRGRIRIVGKDGSIINTHNCTIYNGRRFILESLFRQEPVASQQLTLNKILGVNENVTVTSAEKLARAICLCGVGIGGAQLTFGDVTEPTGNDNNLYQIIPWRTVGAPLTGDLAQQYFMRKYETIGGNSYYNYYLKKVNCDGISAIHEEVDYEPKVDDNQKVHNPVEPLGIYNIKTFTTIPIKIDENDLKDYFRAENGNITKARFNEMSLYFGVPVTINAGAESYIDYALVEAFSHLTFNNRPMDNDGASYDFTYYVLT